VQNPPENSDQEEVVARFLGQAPGALPSLLILAAHPGDEVVGAGGQLHRYAAMENGFPEALLVVHATREGTGQWREAFSAGGLHEGCRVSLGFEGGEWPFNPNSEVDRGDLTQFAGRECHSSGLTVSKDTSRPSSSHRDSASCISSSAPKSEFGFNLAYVVRILLAHLWEFRPVIILTHAYEGGDPACDTCAFAAQVASRLMIGEIGAPPVRLEMTTFHAGKKALLFPSAEGGACAERITLLDEAARLRKATLLAHFPAFAHLAVGTSIGERFRIAPDYDFLQLPSSGRVGFQWFDQVREAERELQSR
jgi:LmbE family N-acetylglucosaminyl deacetylase